MSVVVNRIEIAGTLDRVFELVTTAKYWPQWHPATIDRNAVECQMSSDSAEGLRRLRVLVERMLKS